MRHFTVSTDDRNRLGLRELCQAYCNDQYLAAHMTADHAAESVLDQFKRAVEGELKQLSIERNEALPPSAT